MLKRKSGDRSGWKRILKRRYAQTRLDTAEFRGYITLLETVKVAKPLTVPYGKEHLSIVDDGYMWLQQFPQDQHHAVTTVFDARGEVVQWYIDVTLRNGVEHGIPWMDDLFLDLVLLPSGDLIVLDAEELEDALSTGTIDQLQYELAWDEANRLKESISSGSFDLIKLSRDHMELLSGILE
ncbi:DUF402 domain-containing protein [Rossellomorea aquimaris]|uniref:DUF402 domain-containing protein n=1 Tax=Rossellomorea aquimaris TaxID=189382 RepID=A0A1J6VSW4_9BACI|nr:DUF402 domain-containing protein [Rossellomorea aquimaris]OIU68846.1 hypothetical protein BHE18_16650 [Rossellomorea aquimaris]